MKYRPKIVLMIFLISITLITIPTLCRNSDARFEQKIEEPTHYTVYVRCKNCGNWGGSSKVSILRGETVESSGVKCPKCDVPLSFGREK